MDKTKAEIKKFKKLEQEVHNGTAETGYYTDEFEYCLGRFAEDLCSAGYIFYRKTGEMQIAGWSGKSTMKCEIFD